MQAAKPVKRRSSLFDFFDSFLQERNIKWVLIVGTLILLGSSLMLVAAYWEQYTPAWKYVIMLTYTAAVYVASQWTYHRMVLRRTGAVLMGLTVLLLPVLFLALHFIDVSASTALFTGGGRGISSALAGAGTRILFALLTLGLAARAARTIFNHFLRGEQPTFTVAYLVLCAAGTFSSALPAALTPLATLALWAVFAVGAVKVNRHVWWLVEENQHPRVLGFLPILLLGAQFTMLFATSFAARFELQWLGFGAALLAAPILLTADSLARVFQQRTGDIIRPLPWAIILPLVIGLSLCAAGLVLALTGLPDRAHAMLPAGVLVGAMMLFVARRTGKRAFVWAGLVSMTLAYNFSHFWFSELASLLVSEGASAVREEQLPYAFYGLTYLPLVIALTAVGAWARRAGNTLFGRPARTYGVILSSVLLAASLGHVKAMLPVALVTAATFALQTILYRKRALAVPAVAASLVAVAGIEPFCRDVLLVEHAPSTVMLFFAATAAVLFWPGRLVDRKLAELEPTSKLPWLWPRLLQLTSAGVSLFLAATWLAAYHLHALSPAPEPGLLTGLVIAALLVAHALRWLIPLFSLVVLPFLHVLLLATLIRLGLPTSAVPSWLTVALLGQWGLTYVLERRPDSRLGRAFSWAGMVAAAVALGSAAILLVLPLSLADIVGLDLGFGVALSMLVRFAVVAWLFDAARRLRLEPLGWVACAAALAVTGAAWVGLFGAAVSWLPVLWTSMALAILPVARLRAQLPDGADNETRSNARTILRPLDAAIHAVLGIAAVATLVVFTWPTRIAGLAGVVGLILLGRQRPLLRDVAVMVGQWQVLAWVVFLGTPPAVSTALDLSIEAAVDLGLPLALAAAAAAAAARWFLPPPTARSRDFAMLHRVHMRTITAAGLLLSLALPSLGLSSGLFALALFVLLAIEQVVHACESQKVWPMWLAEGIAGLAVAYFAWFNIIHFGRGLAMFIVLGCAALAWALARLAERHPNTAILAGPLQTTALGLPAAAVLIGVVRHLVLHQTTWLGLNSLGLLLAAAFYFWQGIERQQKRFMVSAATILNLALAFLWNELSFSDPQFYMIPIGVTVLALTQLLKQEIPKRAHDPLYYLGALFILVSPTFNIVSGSWMHLFTLMLASVAVTLVAIGLRLRALIFAGTGFLLADLVAMVVRGSIDNPSVLWVAGLALGAGVVALGAVAENNRERLLQRMRALSLELQTWN